MWYFDRTIITIRSTIANWPFWNAENGIPINNSLCYRFGRVAVKGKQSLVVKIFITKCEGILIFGVTKESIDARKLKLVARTFIMD